MITESSQLSSSTTGYWLADVAECTTETHLAPLSISRQQCSACGGLLAADQRYCVECGQRCGAPRLPFASNLRAAPRNRRPARRPARWRAPWSVNSTVIAGIGTLLLAMGIGVLIGQSGAGSSSSEERRASVRSARDGPSAGAAARRRAAEPATSSTSSQSSKSAATTKSAGAAQGRCRHEVRGHGERNRYYCRRPQRP